jgi:RNA polymerase sigma-70 factor (ECF subfamily)
MVAEATPVRLAVTQVSASKDMPEEGRLESLFHAHYDFVWRSLRRLGVEGGAIDDAAQEVFVVASRKLEAIVAGKEKAFLFGTALRVASDHRRARSRKPAGDDVDVADLADDLSPEVLLDAKRRREVLDAVVARLPDDARPVFVLFELEGMTMAEIAALLDLPPGTVASRLRRARELFAVTVKRLELTRRRDER